MKECSQVTVEGTRELIIQLKTGKAPNLTLFHLIY